MPCLSLDQDHVLLDIRACGSPFSWKQSCSRSYSAWPRGTYVAAHSVGHSKPMATTWVVIPSLVPTQKVESQQEETSSQQQTPPPGFVEIARSLCGDDSPCVVMRIPLELAEVQDLMGSRVHIVLCQAIPRCSFRHHIYQHDDLFHEPSGLWSYSLSGVTTLCPPS